MIAWEGIIHGPTKGHKCKLNIFDTLFGLLNIVEHCWTRQDESRTMSAAESLWSSNMLPFCAILFPYILRYSVMEASHNTLQSFEDELETQPISNINPSQSISIRLSQTAPGHWTRKALQVARCCKVLQGAARSSRLKGDQDQLKWLACGMFGFVRLFHLHWGVWVPLSRAFPVLMAVLVVLVVLMVAVQCLALARAREPKRKNPSKRKAPIRPIPLELWLLSNGCQMHPDALNVTKLQIFEFFEQASISTASENSQGQSTKLFGFMHAQASVFRDQSQRVWYRVRLQKGSCNTHEGQESNRIDIWFCSTASICCSEPGSKTSR